MKINKTVLFSIMGLFCGVLFSGSPTLAAALSVPDGVQADSEKIAKWFSQEVSHLTAFNASALPQLPGDVHGVLGVEMGVSVGVSYSKLDRGAFNTLSLDELKQSEFDLPAGIPLGMPLAHVKVGLPFSLDMGAKYGYLNYDDNRNGAQSKIKNTVVGVEIRRRLLGEGMTGVVLPDVALTLGYDQANGEINRQENYSGPIANSNTLTGKTTLRSKWQTGAVTARVVASKQLLIVTPYIGAGYSRLMGDAKTTMSVVGIVNVGDDVNVSAQGSANAKDDMVQFLGGLEFSFFPTLKFNVGGLYSQDDWAGTMGVRFSFR
ncbi:MAG: hypothetical protein JNK54_09980 [Elusimicrobia bacterium]|jgi:hypothetical protein|nr:hypothetical protein [Elusimicrobiota bacterium]